MDNQYLNYVEEGRKRIADKAIAEEAAAHLARVDMVTKNADAWAEHLEPILVKLPTDLHDYLRYDLEHGPFSSVSYYGTSPLFLAYVPGVDIRIERTHYGTELAFFAQRADKVLSDDADGWYIRYQDGTRYEDVYMAIAEADSFADNNAAVELRLQNFLNKEAGPVEKTPVATLPKEAAPLTMKDALGEFEDGNETACIAITLLLIADSLKKLVNVHTDSNF